MTSGHRLRRARRGDIAPLLVALASISMAQAAQPVINVTNATLDFTYYNNILTAFGATNTGVNLSQTVKILHSDTTHLSKATISFVGGFQAGNLYGCQPGKPHDCFHEYKSGDALLYVDGDCFPVKDCGISGNYSYATGVLHLTGFETLMNYQYAIQAVTLLPKQGQYLYTDPVNIHYRNLSITITDTDNTESNPAYLNYRLRPAKWALTDMTGMGAYVINEQGYRASRFIHGAELSDYIAENGLTT